MADSISIEETNKIRVSLGLKPLPVPGASSAPSGPSFKDSHYSDSDSDASEPGSTLESRQAQSYDNWKKVQEEAEAKKKREERKEAIRKAKDAAARHAKLEGKGLGEVDDADLDTKAWLMQAKKKQKKIEKERERVRKMEEELAERERAIEYTSKDLAGVRVAHEVGDFDGEDQVLTLKDTTIDENEEDGDELENAELVARENLQRRNDLKKKKVVYDPNDEDGQNSLLAQYDEEIEGKKRKRFTLDETGATSEDREAKRLNGDGGLKGKGKSISLDFLEETPAVSDYMDISEIKIKKPKKKKAKSTRQKAVDEDDIFPLETQLPAPTNGDSMDVDGDIKPIVPKKKMDDFSFVDDDDLQASLAAQRRAAFKKRKKVRPEDIARQLKEEEQDLPDAPEDEVGLVIDEMTEFVSTLQRPTMEERPQRTTSAPPARSVSPDAEPDHEGDVKMEPIDGEDEKEILARIKRETSASATPDITATGLDEEETIGQGLGSVVNMLRQRGLVEQSNAGELTQTFRERQRFLAEKQRREEEAERRARLQRERDRASGKLQRMSAREREEYAQRENKQRDQYESRHMAEVFDKEYKPNVQLKYVDEHGRSLNQKEAFKHLSHQFHGKGSGKQKTEKLLKKMEDEKNREAASMLDSSERVNAVDATARKNRQAGIRLQ